MKSFRHINTVIYSFLGRWIILKFHKVWRQMTSTNSQLQKVQVAYHLPEWFLSPSGTSPPTKGVSIAGFGSFEVPFFTPFFAKKKMAVQLFQRVLEGSWVVPLSKVILTTWRQGNMTSTALHLRRFVWDEFVNSWTRWMAYPGDGISSSPIWPHTFRWTCDIYATRFPPMVSTYGAGAYLYKAPWYLGPLGGAI